MAQITWNRGVSAQQQVTDIEAIIDGADVGAVTQQIIDSLEVYSYDDSNLTPPQTAALNSYFNSNGWTDVTP